MSRNQPQNINSRQQSRRIDTEEKLKEYIRTMLGEPLIALDVSDDQIYLLIDDTVRKFSDFAYGGEQRIAFVVDGYQDIQDYRMDNRVQAILSVSWGNNLGSVNSNGASGGITLGSGWGTIGVGYVPHITLQGEVSSLTTGSATGANGVAGGVAGGPGSSGTYADRLTDAFVIRSQRDSMQALVGVGVNFEFNANTKILRVFEQIQGPFVVEAAAEYIPNPEYDEIYSHPWVKDYAVALTRRLWSTITGKYSQSLVGGAEINFDKMQQEAEAELERLNEDLLNKYSEALGVFSG